MERRLEKVMRTICACALVLTETGCVETAPEVEISEPDPELNFVRGYRSVTDECQLVGETAFTVDFLDDAADLVVCPTGSAAMASLMAETGAPVITQTNSFSFFSIPYR
ncbi:hypothetical protein LCL97_24020 [Seohaeicola saemankumensis]|nr:hypothetical protein [Seohaeicola saemankumensis]MCA0873906.1 hypothetical protein [Seohaeicola saemankumensis]